MDKMLAEVEKILTTKRWKCLGKDISFNNVGHGPCRCRHQREYVELVIYQTNEHL